MLDDRAAVPNVEQPVASLAATGIKPQFQACFPGVAPRSPHELRTVHFLKVVPKGTKVECLRSISLLAAQR